MLVLTYIGVSAPEQGVSGGMVFCELSGHYHIITPYVELTVSICTDLVSIANGAGGIGRLAFGVLGDYFGKPSRPIHHTRSLTLEPELEQAQ